MEFLKTVLEGSVDHIIYRDYVVNRRFFCVFFNVVWPHGCLGVIELESLRVCIQTSAVDFCCDETS